MAPGWFPSWFNGTAAPDDNDSVFISLSILEMSESETLERLHEDIKLVLMISSALWWFVVVASVVSLPFYGYAFRILWRQREWRYWQYIVFSIIVADTIMLCDMFSSLLITKYYHEFHMGNKFFALMRLITTAAQDRYYASR